MVSLTVLSIIVNQKTIDQEQLIESNKNGGIQWDIVGYTEINRLINDYKKGHAQKLYWISFIRWVRSAGRHGSYGTIKYSGCKCSIFSE